MYLLVPIPIWNMFLLRAGSKAVKYLAGGSGSTVQDCPVQMNHTGAI